MKLGIGAGDFSRKFESCYDTPGIDVEQTKSLVIAANCKKSRFGAPAERLDSEGVLIGLKPGDPFPAKVENNEAIFQWAVFDDDITPVWRPVQVLNV